MDEERKFISAAKALHTAKLTLRSRLRADLSKVDAEIADLERAVPGILDVAVDRSPESEFAESCLIEHPHGLTSVQLAELAVAKGYMPIAGARVQRAAAAQHLRVLRETGRAYRTAHGVHRLRREYRTG
jgi:hypothetical protein